MSYQKFTASTISMEKPFEKYHLANWCECTCDIPYCLLTSYRNPGQFTKIKTCWEIEFGFISVHVHVYVRVFETLHIYTWL